MNFEASVTIEALSEQVWAVLTDVERWPEWTASMRSVKYVEGQSVAVGTRVRFKQPRLPSMVWEVTEVTPGVSFSWQARSGGVTTQATHRLSTGESGRTTVRFGIQQSGFLAGPVGALTGGMARRYVGMEVEGLRRRCQAPLVEGQQSPPAR
jgi:uncharacterized protein YndB with AHSA1/START domain